MSADLIFNEQPRYDTATLPQYWSASQNATVDSSGGYNGGKALSGSNINAYVRQQFLSSIGTAFSIGGRVKFTSFPSSEKIFFAVPDASGTLLMCATCKTDGTIALYKGEFVSLLGIYSTPISTGSHLRIAMKGILGSGITGSAYLYIGGSLVLSVTGVDTGSTPWAGVYFGLASTILMSHVYATNGDPIHAHLVDVITVTDSRVSDAVPDGDITSINVNLGDITLVPLDTVPTRVLTLGVSWVNNEKASLDEGSDPIIQLNGSNYEQSRRPVTTTYKATRSDVVTRNPSTSLPLTSSLLSTAKIGEKRVV